MRYHYLDNIRWVTVLLVMFFHVFYYFNAYFWLTITTFGQDAYSPADIRSVGNNLYAWFATLHNKDYAHPYGMRIAKVNLL